MAEIAFERKPDEEYFQSAGCGFQKEAADPGYDGGCSADEQRLCVRGDGKWRNSYGSRGT